MKAEEIKEAFLKLKEGFADLKEKVSLTMKAELNLAITENPTPLGGCEWVINVNHRKATIRMYYDGTTLVCLQEELTLEEKICLKVFGDFLDLTYCSFEIFYLTDDCQLDEVVKRLKGYLI